jgi:hypothetical protein
MTTDLVIVTEASDKYFKYSIASVCSFLENNKWFRGKLYFLISSKNPLSKANKAILSSIYPKVNFIDVESSKLFKSVSDKFHSLHPYPMASIQDLSKTAALDLFDEHVFYFSNFCLFMNDISSIFQTDGDFVFSQNVELFYLKRDFIELCSPNYTFDGTESLGIGKTYSFICNMLSRLGQCTAASGALHNSEEFIDNKFLQLQTKLRRALCIYFNDLLSQETTRKNSIVLSPNRSTSKIKRVWLSRSNEYSKQVTSPRSNFIYNYLETSNLSQVKTHTADFNRKVNKMLRDSSADELFRYRLDKSKLIESIKETEILIKGELNETAPVNGYETACIIAFKGRHRMVELNVETLCKQTLLPAIVLIASSASDAQFCEELRRKHNNVFFTIHQNYPIGGKWQAGVDYARRLNVKGLMILGSDDLLSLNYFSECYSSIDEGRGSSGNGFDLVGNRSWYIYDIDKNLYFLQYTPGVEIFLGGGKMFSKNFLDKVDWQIFRTLRPFHLDEFGYYLVKKHGNSMKQVSLDSFILSVKGAWEVINSTSDILKASSRITNKKVNDKVSEILNSLKITNIDDYLT